MVSTRTYNQKARAEKAGETRRRIVDATIHLHSTIGPARTTIKSIAELAGVGRPTVYSHFPTLDSLHMACSMKSMNDDPPPDPSSWRKVNSHIKRLRIALTETYAYFRRNAERIANVQRDMASTERHSLRVMQQMMNEHAKWVRSVLAEGFTPRDPSMLDAALLHVLEFDTWRTLAHLGKLEDATAVELAIALVRASAK